MTLFRWVYLAMITVVIPLPCFLTACTSPGSLAHPDAELDAEGASESDDAGSPHTMHDASIEPPDAAMPDATDDSDAMTDSDAAVCPEPYPGGTSDLLWLVDTTASWTTHADRFDGVRDAIRGATSEWQLGAQALTRFPRFEADDLACASETYEPLDLDWGTAPSDIAAQVDDAHFLGASGLAPALSGVIHTARERASLTNASAVSVLLVTDATPRSDEACDSEDWNRIAAIAADAFQKGRRGGVRIHVVSVIAGGVVPDHFPLLGTIATAGGGYVAFVNGSRSDVAHQIDTAIRDIRTRTEVCTYELMGAEAPARLYFRFPDGTERVAERVADASECEGATFYADDPSTPARVTLCSGEFGVGGFCQLVMTMSLTLGNADVRAAPCAP